MSYHSKPPVAGRRPHSFTRHGVTIEDPWRWLRDPNYPNVGDADVLAYLAAENDYFDANMSPFKDLTDTIFEEMKAREQPDLSDVPWKREEWYYQWRYEEGSQYRDMAALARRRSERAGGPNRQRPNDSGRACAGRRFRVLQSRWDVGQ